MNINPMFLIQLIKNGFNPQQLVMNVLKQQREKNPILDNAASLAQQGDVSALEILARNLAKQRGLDFDKEFSNFKQYLK